MASTSADRIVRPDNHQRSVLANALRVLAIDAVQTRPIQRPPRCPHGHGRDGRGPVAPAT